jgi:hypothetical protein
MSVQVFSRGRFLKAASGNNQTFLRNYLTKIIEARLWLSNATVAG